MVTRVTHVVEIMTDESQTRGRGYSFEVPAHFNLKELQGRLPPEHLAEMRTVSCTDPLTQDECEALVCAVAGPGFANDVKVWDGGDY